MRGESGAMTSTSTMCGDTARKTPFLQLNDAGVKVDVAHEHDDAANVEAQVVWRDCRDVGRRTNIRKWPRGR